jgi:hypothetical protein
MRKKAARLAMVTDQIEKAEHMLDLIGRVASGRAP